MKKNTINQYMFCAGIILLVYASIFSTTTISNISVFVHEQPEITQNKLDLEPRASSIDNYATLESIFAQKLSDYAQLGYFPQYYKSSLQATYYALYILDVIGKLEEIDQGAVLDYIMSHYNEETHMFMDDYSYRYLDSIFPRLYYPFTSVLQVNCYAILSLDILNRLYMIDTQEAIDFIWSCFNPEGTENGFIGRPYDQTLSYGFKTATMDNSFYAITTLNLLMNDWSGHDSELTSLVNFINGLQVDIATDRGFGGFYNEHDPDLDSFLMLTSEVNMLASFYNVKTLSALDLVDTVQLSNFHQYLTNLYDVTTHSFEMFNDVMTNSNIANLIGTALGLELADITGYTGLDRNAVVNFILSNRNALGTWDSSTISINRELIDTFQVVRSLKESGVLNQLTSQEKSQIASSLELYQQFEGYSLLSKDHMSFDLVYSIINSFSLFGRISDLDISELYTMIETNYEDEEVFGYGFDSCTNLDHHTIGLRSYPIEYFSLGEHKYTNITGAFIDHKRNYFALDSLLRMFKLDDFHNKYDLMNIFNNVIDAQYLEEGFDNYGAFVLSWRFGPVEYQNHFIFFEYSYYAIKTLELISNYLHLGDLNVLPFNSIALYEYIEKNIVETNTTLYFDPQFTTNPSVTLKYTYYMAYILKALNLDSLNLNKLTQFVLNNLDYKNIFSLYYCYKISDLLNLNVEFDLKSTQNLVANVFSDEYHEFFVDTAFKELDQESFLWVCDLAANSEFVIECEYQDSIILGGVNTLTTSFCNMIFPEYGSDIVVKFESPTLGSIPLERQSNTTYQANVMVPEEPQNFPYINGSIKSFKNTAVIGEAPIFFRTSLNQIVTHSYKFEGNTIRFEINVSRALVSGDHSVSNSYLFADIYKENVYLNTLQLHRKHYANHSTFSLTHEVENAGTYTYNFTIADEFYPDGCCVLSIQHAFSPPDLLSIEMNGFLLATIGLAGSTAVVGSTVTIGNKVKKRRNRKIIQPQQTTNARDIVKDVEETLYDEIKN